MKVIRCEKGHFYDSDLYQTCPHCSVPRNSNAKSKEPLLYVNGKEKTAPAENEKRGFFDSVLKKGKKKEKSSIVLTEQKCKVQSEQTILLSSGQISDVRAQLENPAPEPVVKKVETPPEVAPVKKYETVKQVSVNSKEPTDYGRPEERSAPLGDDSDSGMTVGFFESSSKNVTPVVGWIVGVGGIYRGVSFELRSGGNSIGRAADNSICLKEDNHVSRKAHTLIVYEPRNRVFYIQPGTGSGLTYVNGEIILHHSALNGGDIIEIGGGRYIFEPLCSSAFSWENFPEFQPICRDGVTNSGNLI